MELAFNLSLTSHIAGLGYSFFHNGLRDHAKPIGCDEFSGHPADFQLPLVHQPGDGWQYGVRVERTLRHQALIENRQ